MRTNRFDGLKLISFDVWLTLIKSNPEFKPRRMALFMQAFGIGQERAEEFSRVTRETDVACDHESDRTGVQYGPEDRLRKIAEALGIALDDAKIAEAAAETQELIVELCPHWNEPDMLESLALIKGKGYEIGLVSNTGFLDGDAMRRAFEKMGLMPLVMAAVFSNEAGVAKPNPAIFARLAGESGITPANILHVGDNFLADYQGATAAGLRAAWLTQARDENAQCVDSIRSLAAELPTIL